LVESPVSPPRDDTPNGKQNENELSESERLLRKDPSTLARAEVSEALEMLSKRHALETERIDKIDTKIAALLGGLIATLAFLLDHASWWISMIALVLLAPIAMLGWALRGRQYLAVPKPDPVLKALTDNEWRQLQLEVLGDTATAIRDTVTRNSAKVDWINRAIGFAFCVVLIVSILKAFSLYSQATVHEARANKPPTQGDMVMHHPLSH
jgi:hypothetical protein